MQSSLTFHSSSKSKKKVVGRQRNLGLLNNVIINKEIRFSCLRHTGRCPQPNLAIRVYFLPKILFLIISNLLSMNIPDDCYSRKASCALNLISTFYYTSGNICVTKIKYIMYNVQDQSVVYNNADHPVICEGWGFTSTPRNERDSKSQRQWRQPLIAQVVVNPSTIRPRPRQPLHN